MTKVYSIDGVIPVIDPTSFVHPTAVLIGDVVIGPKCYVAPGVSLRGDMGPIVIGGGSSVQDNCIAHTFAHHGMTVGEDCNIGHGAILHGCHLGAHVLVGMNSVLMDGSEVGDYAFVAAMSFLRTGFKMPPRTVAAGVPARVLRDLTEREIEWKGLGDQDYVEMGRRALASMELVDALTEIVGEGPRIKVDGITPLNEYRED